MPCHAMPCYAMLCYAMMCCAVPCRAVPCRAVPCLAVLSYPLSQATRRQVEFVVATENRALAAGLGQWSG